MHICVIELNLGWLRQWPVPIRRKVNTWADEESVTAGPRLNIKTVLSTYGDFHVKDKTAVRTSYL